MKGFRHITLVCLALWQALWLTAGPALGAELPTAGPEAASVSRASSAVKEAACPEAALVPQASSAVKEVAGPETAAAVKASADWKASYSAPKYEFRGAWISTVAQAKYAKMSAVEMQDYFMGLLDSLQRTGINVVLFQVRPQADAWYKSSLEPWSMYITGKSGRNPGWDPLAFMVEACHARGMDIHAWVNPYRVRLTFRESDWQEAFIRRHRDWTVRYGRSLWFDPGIPACRRHIVKVIREIVSQYDVDGLHMDDYFYPYPIAGESFADARTYARYSDGTMSLADWRRDNVNTLVQELSQAIHEEKPWVQFGISPFGIWRNHKDDAEGSQTNGLANYDDLYADALLWMREGWIDYCIPQLYWELNHPQAAYTTLLDWWARHAYGCPLVVGQDVARSVKPRVTLPGDPASALPQLREKMDLQRANQGTLGSCFFPAYELETNTGGAATLLRENYYAHPALVPTAALADTLAPNPEPVYALDVRFDYELGCHLVWKRVNMADPLCRASSFVVYRVRKGQPEDLSDASNIVCVTSDCRLVLPPHPAKGDWVYLVTSLNRLHRESAPERIVVRVK